MKLRELKRQNDLAGQLQSKLERIAKLYSALPNGDGLLVMVKHASDLEERLARAKEAYCDPAFPTADELKPTVEAAAWWYIAMEDAAHTQLLAEAAGEPKPIPHEVAKLTHSQVGSPEIGYFSFQPLWDWIVAEEPDLLD